MVSYPIRHRSQHCDPGIRDWSLQLISSEEDRHPGKAPADKTLSLVSLATPITVKTSPCCSLICAGHQWRQSHLQGLCPNTPCLPRILSELLKQFMFLHNSMVTMPCRNKQTVDSKDEACVHWREDFPVLWVHWITLQNSDNLRDSSCPLHGELSCPT